MQSFLWILLTVFPSKKNLSIIFPNTEFGVAWFLSPYLYPFFMSLDYSWYFVMGNILWWWKKNRINLIIFSGIENDEVVWLGKNSDFKMWSNGISLTMHFAQPLKSVASVWDNFDSHCTIQLLYTCWKFEIRVLNMRFMCAPFCRSKHTTLTQTFAKQNQNQSRMLKHVLCVRSLSQNQLKHTLHLFYSCSVTRKKFNFSFPYVAIFSMEFGSEVARTP